MTIRIRKSSRYSVVDNQFINDPRLSWKAKGVMVFLLSKPDDWKITLAHLAKTSIDRIDSTRGALVELRKCGYLVGSDLYERPLENPRGAIGGPNDRSLENPTLLSTDINTELNTHVESGDSGSKISASDSTVQQSPVLSPPPQVAAAPPPKIGEARNRLNVTSALDSTVSSCNIRADTAKPAGHEANKKLATGNHPQLVEFFTVEWAKVHGGLKYPFAARDAVHVKYLLDKLDNDLAWAQRTVLKYLKTKEPFFDGHPLGKLVACLHKFMVSAAPPKRDDGPARPTMECQE